MCTTTPGKPPFSHLKRGDASAWHTVGTQQVAAESTEGRGACLSGKKAVKAEVQPRYGVNTPAIPAPSSGRKTPSLKPVQATL